MSDIKLEGQRNTTFINYITTRVRRKKYLIHVFGTGKSRVGMSDRAACWKWPKIVFKEYTYSTCSMILISYCDVGCLGPILIIQRIYYLQRKCCGAGRTVNRLQHSFPFFPFLPCHKVPVICFLFKPAKKRETDRNDHWKIKQKTLIRGSLRSENLKDKQLLSNDKNIITAIGQYCLIGTDN